MTTAKERTITISWEDLADTLFRAGLLIGKEENIDNITLMKPKRVQLQLSRSNEKEKNDVSK